MDEGGGGGRKRSRERLNDNDDNEEEHDPISYNKKISHDTAGSIASEVDKEENGDINSPSSLSSVESLLSVPIDFILREVKSNGGSMRRARRTLLSRGEACALIRTSQLSVEMDVLLSVAEQAIDRAASCRQYKRDFLQHVHNCNISRGFGMSGSSQNNGHFLRPVLPLLDVHGGKAAMDAVDHVAHEVGRVISELATCCVTIRQFAEQNWSVAESLFDTLAEGGGDCAEEDGGLGYVRNGVAKRRRVPGRDLAREKRMVAEVEEAVCDRIDALIGMAAILPTDECNGGDKGDQGKEFGLEDVCLGDAFELATNNETGRFLPMWELCKQLLGDDDPLCDDGTGMEQNEKNNVNSHGDELVANSGGRVTLEQGLNPRPDTTGSIDNAAAALAVLASAKPSISSIDADE